MSGRDRIQQDLPVGWGPDGPVPPRPSGIVAYATHLIVLSIVSFGALALVQDPVTTQTGADGAPFFRSVTVLSDAMRVGPAIASIAVWIALITMLRSDSNLDALGPAKGITAALLALVVLPLAVAVPIVRQSEWKWVEHGPVAADPQRYSLLELSQRTALLTAPPRIGLLGRVYEGIIAQVPLDATDYPRVAWPTHRGVEVQRAADGVRLVCLDDGSCVFVFDPMTDALRRVGDLDFADIPVFLLVGKDDQLDPRGTSWLEEALRDFKPEQKARLARRLGFDRDHANPRVRALVADLLKRLAPAEETPPKGR